MGVSAEEDGLRDCNHRRSARAAPAAHRRSDLEFRRRQVQVARGSVGGSAGRRPRSPSRSRGRVARLVAARRCVLFRLCTLV
eukprot:360908-Chlamydomonas_euryale.AAC.6